VRNLLRYTFFGILPVIKLCVVLRMIEAVLILFGNSFLVYALCILLFSTSTWLREWFVTCLISVRWGLVSTFGDLKVGERREKDLN